MPEYLILLLMQVTIFSSITALIIIAVKTLFRCRIPPLIGAVMWLVLFARLVCPIYPESRLSVYNLIPAGRSIMYSLANNADRIEEESLRRKAETNPYVVQTVLSTDGTGETEAEDTSYVEYASDEITYTETDDSYKEGTKAVVSKRTQKIIILAVYAVGIIIAHSILLRQYRVARRRAIRTSSECTDEKLLAIYRAVGKKLEIPENKLPGLRLGNTDMLAGVLSPVVIVRDDIDIRDAEMIFSHELNHFKGYDNAILFVSSCVVCLYWYNPLIWIVRHMLREDIEVLCDARTLRVCGIPATEYAVMLCRISQFGELRQSMAEGFHMSASGRRLKFRLRTISHTKSGEHRFLPRFGSALLCASMVTVCLTNPIISQNTEYSEYIENYAELTGGDEMAMQLSGTVTVSAYLSQVCTILEKNGLEEMKKAIGNGSMERFRRICGECDTIDSDIRDGIRNLRTDGVMTNRSLVLINSGLCAILASAEIDTDTNENTELLPKAIPVWRMNELCRNLTETEKDALLSCYNIGVSGADVQFSEIYTDAMMQLILSRINREWSREKFLGYYTRFDLSSIDCSIYSEELRTTLESLRNVKTVYLCDPNATDAEKKRLEEILGAAVAGQDEEVYYLKEQDDVCPVDVAKILFARAGYTLEDMLDDYAEMGLVNCTADYGGETDVGLPTVRSSSAIEQITGSINSSIRNAAGELYEKALIDTDEEREIDLLEEISCGESLRYAYRFVCGLVEK